MKCEHYEERISQYVDRELDDAKTRELFLHLGTCYECQGFLRSLLLLRDSIRRDVAVAASKSLDARMKNIVPGNASRMVGDRRGLSRFLGKRISVSAAVAVVVLIALFASSAFVATTFFAEPQIVEKKVQETIYIVQLPQVEVKGYYPTTTKSN